MSTYHSELPTTIYLTDATEEDGTSWCAIQGSNLGWYETPKTAKRYGRGKIMEGTITWHEVDEDGNPVG